MNVIVVNGTQARTFDGVEPFVTGQSNFDKVGFRFDNAWDGMTKIAQFVQGSNRYNVAVENNECICPSELVKGCVFVRVRGYSATDVIATANEIQIPVEQGFESGGVPPVPPTPDLYQKLLGTVQDRIGDLDELKTEDKSSLVAAVNEVQETGGGGGTSDHSLTFTGAVTGSYNGSAPLTVDIPAIDSTLTVKGKVADAKAVGDALITLSEDIANLQTSGLTTAQVNALDGMFKVCAFTKDNVSAEYTAFKTAFGIADSGGDSGGGDSGGGETEVTLTSISATYSGGDVAVGAAVTELTGIVVTAHYSDGTSRPVTEYTLDGTIAEGDNTITVIYGGKMTEFVVVGVAESGGEVIMLKNISFDGKSYLDTEVIPESVNYRYVLGIQAPSKDVTGSTKNFGGVSARNHTSLAESDYWDIYWWALVKDNGYNPDVPGIDIVQNCMGVNAYLAPGRDKGDGTASQPYDNPLYYSFDNGSQSLWIDEDCTETPVAGVFPIVTGTVDFTNQTNFTDDEHPINSIWLGKVHVTGINSALATEANTYAGVKFYCFKVYDTDENLIAYMKPAKQGDTVGMWDSIRNKFYPATVNGGTVSYEEVSV